MELQNFGVERDLRENIVEFLYLNNKESWAPDRLRYLVQGHMITKKLKEKIMGDRLLTTLLVMEMEKKYLKR